MELLVVILIVAVYSDVGARTLCGYQVPLEAGSWKHDLLHMDTATIENRPVSMREGQVYVYENHFPNRTIQYIHVDNLARNTCGATASVRDGGVGSSSVLIVLHSEPTQEIRSVIDIWGTKDANKRTEFQNSGSIQSLYLFKNRRAVNHNSFKELEPRWSDDRGIRNVLHNL